MKNILFLALFYFFVGCSSQSNFQNHTIVQEVPLLKSKTDGYFKAIGTEPFWSLEISEEMIRFQGIESESELKAPHVEPIRAMDTNTKLYRLNTEKGEMDITISLQNCSDGMSDQKHDYKVTINMKGNSTKENVNYSGCGNYIVDYRLFDLWLLEEIDGKKVSLDDFNKEMPSIEINSSEKKFFGQGGCNRISGNIFQERELLRFTNIISTRMACGEINKENSFLNALQNSTGYKIKNNRLYLTNSDGVKVVFKKID